MNETTVVRLLRKALKTLSDRLLSYLVFLTTFGLACWAMYDPNPHRDGILAGFGVLYLLTLRAERRPHHEPAKPDLQPLETGGDQQQ